MKKYINDAIFTKEIIISKGKGKLTEKAGLMIYKLSERVFRANHRMIIYRDNVYYEDVKSGGLEAGLKNWKTFNHKKYDSAFNYLTEIIKRGQTKIFNEAICNKNSRGESFPHIYVDFWGSEK